MNATRLPLGLAALAIAGAAHAQDAKGCKDSPLLTRMPGSIINFCQRQEYGQFDFPLGGGKERHVEGEMTLIGYEARDGVVILQVFRNVEAALKSAGWTIDYQRGTNDITAHSGRTWLFYTPHGGPSAYDYRFVVEKTMAQEVVANAAALASGLTANGHVVVNGILFDTGKADVKPQSDAALKEVAKAIQKDPGLKVYVVGHTDNAGTLAANMDLSSRRAAAVMKVLSSKYGVAADRLQAFGSGPYSPVTSNDDEDGRALNRRVELVRQ
jgi:outer membrane protein OmpA-like peptidoglycan-associated protein